MHKLLAALVILIATVPAQGGFITHHSQLQHEARQQRIQFRLSQRTVRQMLRGNPSVQQLRQMIPKWVNPKKLQWIFPKNLRIITKWGMDRKIPLPSRMYDTSGWSKDFIATTWWRGLRSYVLTGDVPDTPLWEYLEWRHDLNPERFTYYHPYFEGMFDEPKCVGLLPEGRFWDRLENRFENNPLRFSLNHLYLAPVLKLNQVTQQNCPPNPPQTVVPEPASIVSMGIGLVALGYVSRRHRRRRL